MSKELMQINIEKAQQEIEKNAEKLPELLRVFYECFSSTVCGTSP